jgi:anti-sigma regulatory factor (Ser/Thr protein kinase)
MSNTTGNLTIDADFLSVRKIAEWLPSQLQMLVGLDLAAEVVASIELCIHELAINIVEHAYGATSGRIEIGVGVDHQPSGRHIRFDIIDSGVGFEFDVSTDTAPEVPSIRGYGLLIVKQLSTDIRYRREANSNHWTLLFAVPVHPTTGEAETTPQQFENSKATS